MHIHMHTVVTYTVALNKMNQNSCSVTRLQLHFCPKFNKLMTSY